MKCNFDIKDVWLPRNDRGPFVSLQLKKPVYLLF